MTRYGMVIDVNKCVGCYNCFLTCRDEFAGNEYPGYSAAQPMSGMNWMKVNEIERGQYPHVKVDHVPVTCMHCDSAACVTLDQTGAVYRRPDGIVMIDPEKAKGNKASWRLCPYRQIEWNEELAAGRRSAPCARICWTRASRSPAAWSPAPAARSSSATWTTPTARSPTLVASGTEVMHPEYAMGEKVTLHRTCPRSSWPARSSTGTWMRSPTGIDVVLSGDGGSRTMQDQRLRGLRVRGSGGRRELHGQDRGAGLRGRELTTKTSRRTSISARSC